MKMMEELNGGFECYFEPSSETPLEQLNRISVEISVESNRIEGGQSRLFRTLPDGKEMRFDGHDF